MGTPSVFGFDRRRRAHLAILPIEITSGAGSRFRSRRIAGARNRLVTVDVDNHQSPLEARSARMTNELVRVAVVLALSGNVAACGSSERQRGDPAPSGSSASRSSAVTTATSCRRDSDSSVRPARRLADPTSRSDDASRNPAGASSIVRAIARSAKSGSTAAGHTETSAMQAAGRCLPVARSQCERASAAAAAAADPSTAICTSWTGP
jgi:hypothetical protein